jgi:hypothetical protein
MKRNLIAYSIGTLLVCLFVVSELQLSRSWAQAHLILLPAMVACGFATAMLAASNPISLAMLLAAPASLLLVVGNDVWLRYMSGSEAPLFGAIPDLSLRLLRVALLATVPLTLGGFLGWLAVRFRSRRS